MKNKILISIAILLFSNQLFSQKLVSKTFLASFTSNEVKSKIGNYPFIKYDVDCYKVSYTSLDAKGNPDTLSGLLIVPNALNDESFPTLIYAHGTSDCKTCIPSKIGVSSDADAGLLFAGSGFLSLLPDLVGMGEGRGFQTYIHYETTARAIEDMFLAVKEEKITENNQLYVTGYSQGGYSSMAFQKKMQEKGNIQITAASHMSGPYNLSGIMRDLILSEEPYNYVAYIPNTILGYNEVYGFFDDLSEIFKPIYIKDIQDYYDGKINLTTLNINLIQKLTVEKGAPISHYILLDSVFDEIKNNPNNIINIILKENDVYNFIPESPTRMFYCKGDDQVPYMNSVTAQDSMLSYGAPASLVKAFDVNSTANHTNCTVPAFTQTLLFFANEVSLSLPKDLNKKSQFEIYPNPANNILKFKQNQNEFSALYIYDLQGRLTLSFNNLSLDNEFDISSLPNGVYILKIKSNDGLIVTDKITVQR